MRDESGIDRRYKREYQRNEDFKVMNTALEYCVMFIDFCLREFPEEIDDESLIESLMEWHERVQFHLFRVC